MTGLAPLVVVGPTALTGAQVMATDLRASACLVLLALPLLGELNTSFKLVVVNAASLAQAAEDRPDQVDRAISKLGHKGLKLMAKDAGDADIRKKLSDLDLDFYY